MKKIENTRQGKSRQNERKIVMERERRRGGVTRESWIRVMEEEGRGDPGGELRDE